MFPAARSSERISISIHNMADLNKEFCSAFSQDIENEVFRVNLWITLVSFSVIFTNECFAKIEPYKNLIAKISFYSTVEYFVDLLASEGSESTF
jgi:hypothetical protein